MTIFLLHVIYMDVLIKLALHWKTDISQTSFSETHFPKFYDWRVINNRIMSKIADF